MGTRFRILAVFALSAVLLTAAGPRSTGTFSLDQTAPRFGDSATFTAVTDRTAYPYASVTCYQAGVRVLVDTKQLWSGAFNPQPVVLGYTNGWTSGGADCSAELFYFSSNFHHRTLATLTFSVLP